MSGNRPVYSPLRQACNSTLFYYRGHTSLPSVKSLLGVPSVKDELLSPLSKVTMQVCFLYFCRITEVLHATLRDIVHPDRVVLHGAKRSYSYVIFLPDLSRQCDESEVSDLSMALFPISYINLYRHALRIGINFRVDKSRNSRRLHCARYIFSRQSASSIKGSELADVLRHRTESSYLNYLK